MKIHSGEIKSGTEAKNVNNNLSEKLRQVYFLNGNQRKDTSSVHET